MVQIWHGKSWFRNLEFSCGALQPNSAIDHFVNKQNMAGRSALWVRGATSERKRPTGSTEASATRKSRSLVPSMKLIHGDGLEHITFKYLVFCDRNSRKTTLCRTDVPLLIVTMTGVTRTGMHTDENKWTEEWKWKRGGFKWHPCRTPTRSLAQIMHEITVG